MSKIKRMLLLLLFFVLVNTRFVNLSWGLPYPMHPDERNMANAIQNLKCRISNYQIPSSKFQVPNCFNPHFFAYGQFPLYLGYGIVFLLKFFARDLGTPISFEEAAFSLRLISAIASILNVFALLGIVRLIISNSQFTRNKQLSIINYQLPITFLFFIFSPFFIQFSHFGTTESLLMLLYSFIVYLSLLFSQGKLLSSNFYHLTSIISGIAIATKVSSLLFLVVPIALIIDQVKDTIMHRSISIWYFFTLTLVFSIIFSPHNFISFPEFLGSMKYESDVALGSYRAFYTRQFDGTIPILFQIMKIFPYTLGWPAFIFFIFGFIFLPYKLEFNVFRLAILAGFLPNAFLYAKWTRFMTPILPLMLVTAVLFLVSMYRYILNRISNIKDQISNIHIKYRKFFIFVLRFMFYVLCFMMILPGVAFLSIYQNTDVRFTASEWIYKNIPNNSYILFETANVVDIPIVNPKLETRNSKQTQDSNYQMLSFNFYDLDQNPILQLQLQEHLAKADYIFIPSRRILANHFCNIKYQKSNIKDTYQISKIEVILNLFQNLIQKENKCEYLRKKYPMLNDYYDKLFSGQLGFKKVAEFSSYPKIQILGKTILELPDEEAEETWTVFDHPVIRIYKKI